jgi:hypothetical protein
MIYLFFTVGVRRRIRGVGLEQDRKVSAGILSRRHLDFKPRFQIK